MLALIIANFLPHYFYCLPLFWNIMMLVNAKLNINGYKRIAFQGLCVHFFFNFWRTHVLFVYFIGIVPFEWHN